MIAMREDAAIIYFLGVRVYAFGLYAALGMALALIALSLLLRKAKWRKGTVELAGVLCVGLGWIISRLFFGLMDDILGLGRPMPLWALAQLNTGGYSMMGALIGACMGGILTAKWTKQSAAKMLDFLTPALLLFIACERLGEGYAENFGISRTLTDDMLRGTFLTVEGEMGSYLATYLLESFAAIVLALVMLHDLGTAKKPGDTFLLFLLLFGASQVILESLRYDRHMTVKAFVRLQQIIAILLLGTGVTVLSVRHWNTRRKLSVLALLSVLLAAGLGTAIEFMLDRLNISHYLLYAAFVLVISLPVCLGLKLRKTEG